jgi:hypothetical protein
VKILEKMMTLVVGLEREVKLIEAMRKVEE